MKQTIDPRIPKCKKLLQPTFIAIKELGGSGRNNEIVEQIIKDLGIIDEVADIPHAQNPNKTELEYQTDWARTYLKKYGVLMNKKRGIWSISPDYLKIEALNEEEIYKAVNRAYNDRRASNSDDSDLPEDDDPTNDDEEFPDELKPWTKRLADILLQMNPYTFEVLIRQVLRESGFAEVRVTPKSQDGGIDGLGKYVMNDIISFSVAFQCKRYRDTVGASAIRDFRGSLSSSVDKGLFITTGTFTRAAIEEASKQGSKTIDLIDGEQLISLLAKLELGVRKEEVIKYEYKVDEEYFKLLDGLNSNA